MTAREFLKEVWQRLGYDQVSVQKLDDEIATFQDSLARRQFNMIMEDVSVHSSALMDTLYGIVYGQAGDDRAALAAKAIADMAGALDAAVASWLSPESVSKEGRKISAERLNRLRGMAKMLQELLREVDAQKGGGAMGEFKKEGLAAEVLKHIEDLEKRVEAAEQGQKAAEEALAKAKDKKEPEKDEDVLKDLSPAARALIEKQQKEMDALKQQSEESAKIAKEEREQRILKEYEGRIGDYKSLGLVKADASILKAIDEKLTKEEAKRLWEVLKQADASLLKSALFHETGVGGGESDAGTAVGEFENKCNEAIEKKEAKNMGEAVELIGKREPDLYLRYRDEQLQRGGAKSRS